MKALILTLFAFLFCLCIHSVTAFGVPHHRYVRLDGVRYIQNVAQSPIQLVPAPLRARADSGSDVLSLSEESNLKVYDNDLSSIHQAFDNTIDEKAGGGLDEWGLFDALSTLDMKITQEGCMSLLKEFDADGNGVISRDEFVTLVQKKIPKDVFEIFCSFETRGYLTRSKLRDALGALSIDLNSSETKELIHKYDANNDGKLGPIGFAELVSRSPTAKIWLKVDPSGRIRKTKALLTTKLKASKKKPVSFHSTFSILSFGMFLMVFVPLFDPGLTTTNMGFYPHVFDYTKAANFNTMKQTAVTSWMLTLTAIFGTFRIPKNSPPNRRLAFKSFSTLFQFFSLYLSSNLLLSGVKWFDLFSLPGRLLAMIAIIRMSYYLAALVEDAIAGPNEQRDTIPLMTTRLKSFLVSSFLFFMSGFFILPAIPILTSTIEVFNQMVAPFTQFESFLSVFILAMQGAISLTALIQTLRFERKISKSTGTLLSLLTFVVGSYDLFSYAFGSLFFPEKVMPGAVESGAYFLACSKKVFLAEAMISTYVLFVAKGFYRRWQDHKKKKESVQINTSVMKV